ncbi:hypothetical protein RHSIM_Rhsim13G0123000 [Rhododendron simsii]|uniref:Uncharacterized protein n=1 Tax=Rhododendron simsii TaxID=118357 RepID=A0A834FYN9_RHOSS|nr:hypothetical protein RHSIM_Rhsim13G0123000 [Rhododendron simsii]
MDLTEKNLKAELDNAIAALDDWQSGKSGGLLVDSTVKAQEDTEASESDLLGNLENKEKNWFNGSDRSGLGEKIGASPRECTEAAFSWSIVFKLLDPAPIQHLASLIVSFPVMLVVMEADVVVKHQVMNPCCAVLKEKYSKLEEKRNALRQAVKMQNEAIDKLQNENLSLIKENEEGRVQADIERQESAKESDMRISLENEVRALKSEILSLQQKGSSESQDLDGEVMLLRT